MDIRKFLNKKKPRLKITVGTDYLHSRSTKQVIKFIELLTSLFLIILQESNDVEISSTSTNHTTSNSAELQASQYLSLTVNVNDAEMKDVASSTTDACEKSKFPESGLQSTTENIGKTNEIDFDMSCFKHNRRDGKHYVTCNTSSQFPNVVKQFLTS